MGYLAQNRLKTCPALLRVNDKLKKVFFIINKKKISPSNNNRLESWLFAVNANNQSSQLRAIDVIRRKNARIQGIMLILFSSQPQNRAFMNAYLKIDDLLYLNRRRIVLMLLYRKIKTADGVFIFIYFKLFSYLYFSEP